MNELRYENWTQGRTAQLDATAGQQNSLAMLLLLAREDEATLQADLRDVSAARGAAARSVRSCERNMSSDNVARLSAVRRLLDSLERSEGDIRARLAKAKAEAARLAGLMARYAAAPETAAADQSSACHA